MNCQEVKNKEQPFARAMIENPELILADEPTGNLDSNTSLQVIKTLVHINETLNKTVVMVTHDP